MLVDTTFVIAACAAAALFGAGLRGSGFASEAAAMVRRRVRTVALVTYSASVVLIVALSFQAWFYRRESFGLGDSSGLHNSADAWQASSLWTIGVCALVGAALLGVLSTITRGLRTVFALRVFGFGGAVTAAALWLRQWWLIAHPPPPSGARTVVAVVTRDAAQLAALDRETVAIHRDGLAWYGAVSSRYEHAGQAAASYLTFGLAVGLTAMLAASVALATRRLRAEPRHVA